MVWSGLAGCRLDSGETNSLSTPVVINDFKVHVAIHDVYFLYLYRKEAEQRKTEKGLMGK